MTDAPRPRPADEERARRRRLAEVFGDVLPEQSRDDTSGPDERDSSNDEWLRAQVPPHHGGT